MENHEDVDQNRYVEDEKEEEEEKDEDRGKRLLSILFGNVDDAGDLDEEYLDQDAKEHLSGLALQLGQSLVDIDLSTGRKRSATLPDEEEQEDYARKAEDAVDYEDIEEQYDGPEVQIYSEDEQAISKDQQFYAEAAIVGPSLPGSFIPEEENYDEEDEEDNMEAEIQEAFSRCEPEDSILLPDVDLEVVLADDEAFTEETELHELETFEAGSFMLEEIPGDSPRLNLPVLCEEDGKEVLKFSDLFTQQEPPWIINTDRWCQKPFLKKGHYGAVEEDEEILLKSHFLEHLKMEDQLLLASRLSDENGETLSGEQEDQGAVSKMLEEDYNVQARSERHSCLSSRPMKEQDDSGFDAASNIPSPLFQPVCQDEWEARICWDHDSSHNPFEATIKTTGESISNMFDKLEVDTVDELEMGTNDEITEYMGDKPSKFGSDCMFRRRQLGEALSKDIEHQDTYDCFRPLLIGHLTPLSQLQYNQEKTRRRHPQVLRLEMPSILKEQDKQLQLEKRFSAKERNIKDIQNLQKIGMLNAELVSGRWVEHIVWDGEQLPAKRPEVFKVLFDLQDDQMVFELPDTMEGKHLCAHAAAMVFTRRSKISNTETGDLPTHNSLTAARFNISNDKYYLNKKGPLQHKANTKKRALHGIKVVHSLPALKLQTMKPKLTNKDLANFHRPKAVWYPHHNEVAAKEQGQLFVKGPMKIILKPLGGKGRKLHVDASETLNAVKFKIRKKLDLKPWEKASIYYSGKQLDDLRTLADQGVPPNSVLHLVRTKVHPWSRAQRLPGENKPLRPPGAFKKKSELSVKDGHVALMEYCEEHPLLLGNIGMGARISTYYRKVAPDDTTSSTLRSERPWIGSIMALDPLEGSPFLGDIKPGTTQTCLETNMYRSPIFQHKVPTTDFLLVRSAKGKLSLRRIDSIHVVGQQEPHMEVLTPSSKNVQNYICNRLLVHMYREFRSNEKPGCLPRVRSDELTAQFPSLSEGYLRKRLKHCADLQKGPGGEVWVMRRGFRIPSEEELRRMLTPENVCAYESMQTGVHHLKRMGVNKLTQLSGLNAAMTQLPDEAIDLAAASLIERELQITPWNLSCNFVAAMMLGKGSLERLEITGAGDPSGRGLGFSYLRAAPKAPGSGALVKKEAAAARGGGAVTGTDADLRRLSMDAAREVLLKFQVPEAYIEKMTRWHRIALVRKLSSEQAASGLKVGVAALNKFARGQRMSFLQLQQQTREKCQEIWDRQVQSLSAIEGELSEGDGEANEDLDSFAGDLENLLEAEEAHDEEVTHTTGQKEITRGMGVRRRALEAEREDLEDEEAEAAELRRMLREDDEIKGDKKQVKVNAERMGDQGMHTISKVPKTSSIKTSKKFIKHHVHTKNPDGTSSRKEILIKDPKEVAKFLAKKKNAQKGGNGKEPKKPSLPGTKENKPASENEGKKVLVAEKKPLKGKPMKDGLKVVCGACGQKGHMRTNKKCPLYKEDTENVQKQDTGGLEKPVEKLKVTLKGTLQKKQAGSETDPKMEKPEKLPSLKIKLPIVGHTEPLVDVMNEGVAFHVAPGSSECKSVVAKPFHPLDGDANVPTKIKVKKQQNIVRDDGVMNAKEMEGGKQTEKQSNVNEAGLMKELGEVMTVEHLEKKRHLQVDIIKDMTRENYRGEEMGQERRAENMYKENREQRDDIRKKAKHRLRMEKEKRRAKKEERRKRRKEKERIMKQRELEREEAELERKKSEELERRKLEIERQNREAWIEMDMRRMRMKERAAELERQRQLNLHRETDRATQEDRMKEFHMQQQHRNKEPQEAAEKTRARKEFEREWQYPVNEKRKGVKRKASLEHESYHSYDCSSQPKRRKGGEVMLANILENVVDTLRKKTEISYLFLKPVAKKDAPDYLDVIKYPMDLSTIREKVRKMEYRSRMEFRRDVRQITDNAHIYNDNRNPGIPPLADRLLHLCDAILKQRDSDLTEAEMGVERLDQNPRNTVRTAISIDRRKTSRFH